MENKETTCTPCEQNFERKVNELVKEGEAPDTKQRAKKEAEVKAAFDEHGKSEKYPFPMRTGVPAQRLCGHPCVLGRPYGAESGGRIAAIPGK